MGIVLSLSPARSYRFATQGSKMTPSTESPLRSHRLATVAGIAVSILGIGLIVVALMLSNAAGVTMSADHTLGYLFIAVAGFLISAAGTDLRINVRRLRG